jgi:hypothetical protein
MRLKQLRLQAIAGDDGGQHHVVDQRAYHQEDPKGQADVARATTIHQNSVGTHTLLDFIMLILL